MLPLQHPTTLAIVGETAAAVAARIESRLAPHLRPRRFATHGELDEVLSRTAGEAARVLPAAFDDDIRNFVPGDLYVKVRPSRPADALSVSRQQLISVALMGEDAFDASLQTRGATDHCLRLALVPRAALDRAIAAFQAGAIDSIVITDAPDADDAAVREIKRLTTRYFANTTLPLHLALAANGADFTDDPAADCLLARAKADLNASSHVVIADPPGVLIGQDGEVKAFLLLADRAYAETVRELADERNACEPSPSGFAEADTQAAWAELVGKARTDAGSSHLISSRIDHAYATGAIFEQILSSSRL